jgi:hypothetical protein
LRREAIKIIAFKKFLERVVSPKIVWSIQKSIKFGMCIKERSYSLALESVFEI